VAQELSAIRFRTGDRCHSEVMWIWIALALLTWVVVSAVAGLTLGRVVRARDHDFTPESSRVAAPTA